MRFAKNPVFNGRRELILILQKNIYRIDLSVISQPVCLATGRYILRHALEDVAVVTIIPVTLAHCKLISIPWLILRTETFHYGGHICIETAIHITVPWQHIFVKQQGVFPDHFGRKLVIGEVTEQAVARCESGNTRKSKT